MPSDKYSIQFKPSAAAGLLNRPAGLEDSNFDSLRMTVTAEQFHQLDLPLPIAHYMYAQGQSHEEFPTTISAQDVVKTSDNQYGVQDIIIQDFHERAGLPVPDHETTNRKAIRITDISPQAVDFLLSIHTHWSDPVTDADYREITDQAVAQGLSSPTFSPTEIAIPSAEPVGDNPHDAETRTLRVGLFK